MLPPNSKLAQFAGFVSMAHFIRGQTIPLIFAILTFGIFVGVSSSAALAAAPTQLYGKSVRINWGEQRMQRVVGQGNFGSVSARQDLSIYVSANGRVFSRMTFSSGGGTGKVEQVAGEGGATRVPSFAGRSLQLFMPFQGGMRRVAVEFGDGFGSCSASVTFPIQAGGRSRVGISPITKQAIEFQSITASGASCSVSEGNAVAN
jgi:hypothetical protein